MEQILKRDEKVVLALRQLYCQHGYNAYKMNRFEEYDLYVKNKDFLLSDQVITFSGRNGRLMALKPDVTLSIIKNTPDEPGSVQKVYYNENVYRADKDSNAFREIMQTGLECIGDLTFVDIAEVLVLAAKSLAQISDRFILDISHMGLIYALLECSGLSSEDRALVHDCLRRKSPHELEAICGRAGCDTDTVRKLMTLVRSGGVPDQVIGALSALPLSQREREALEELKLLCQVLTVQGFQSHIRVDFSVGSDMKYYSGVVFKGYVDGIPASVLSGGKYDKLLRKMGRSSSAIGFAIYLDQLERLDPESRKFDVDYILCYGDRDDPVGVLQAVEKLQQSGSVLAVRQPPKNKTWRCMMKYENGEGILLERND